MTLAAANVWLFHVAIDLLAKCLHLHPALENGRQRVRNRRVQLEEFTGVRAQDSWNRAGLAQIRGPFLARGFEQPALLKRAAAKVIPIKVLAFDSCWSSHDFFCKQDGAGQTTRLPVPDRFVFDYR
jgi:hypothetical protein